MSREASQEQHSTPQEKISYALRDRECACGDLFYQHENGVGKCKVCAYSQQPFPACQQFRPAKGRMP